MAISFANTKGKAASKKVDAFEYKDGDNVVRLVGGVLARYVYWIKGTNNKDIPIECLAFDREAESFTSSDVDHVTKHFPDKKCSWSYSINCIDVKNNKVVALNLKKKLFEQILTTAEDLGDPTDPDTGWDVVFKRAKTGPLPFNVEYTLSPLKCKKRALSENERAMVEAEKPIDEKYPRPTPEDVLKTIEKILAGQSADDEDETTQASPSHDKESARDLG